MAGPSYHGRTHGVADDSGTYVNTGTDEIPGLVDALNAASGGSGIQFSVDNVGAWLDVQTNTADPDGYAMHFMAFDEVFWDLDWTDAASLFHVEAYSVLMEALGTTAAFTLHSDYDLNITADRRLQIVGGTDAVAFAGMSIIATNGDIDIQSNNGQVSIQGDTSIVFISPSQQSTPVTLSDVIALLVSYGLAV